MFKPHTIKGRPVPVLEYFPVTNTTAYKVGDALVLTSGTLALCGATAVPRFIAMETKTGVTGETLAVMTVNEDIEFETTFAADASSNAIGTLVTIHSDSAQVTATATSGVFTITKKLGSGASGTGVRGYFRQ